MKSLFPIVAFMALVLSSDTVAAQRSPVIPAAATRFERRSTKAVPDFQKHIVPLLGRLGCNSAKCHGSFQGQGGFRLSLFGFDFRSDHTALRAKASSAGHRIHVKTPLQSLILLKGTGKADHDGGKRFEPNSWEHHLLLRWIESGAKGARFKPTTTKPRVRKPTFSSEGIQFFEKKIRPLFENNCYECHGFNNRKGNLQLNSRETVLRGGTHGAGIVPGSPDKSLLIKAVRHTDAKLQMPPSGKLKAAQISDLEKWVRMGAPWSDRLATAPLDTGQVLVKLHYEPRELLLKKQGDTARIKVLAQWQNGEREDVTCLARFRTNNDAVVTVNRDGRATSTGEGDTHIVAFYDNGVVAIPVLRPYRRRKVSSRGNPKGVKPVGSSLHPVDRFVNEKLTKLGLLPSALCTNAEFLRRVSIDMTGTLPTPGEVTAFLADRSAKKRLKKIDELLKRPSYAAWWSNKLCDFTGCSPASISSLLEVATEEGYVKATQWYDWIYKRVARNQPYDELVAGIMLADLSGRRNGGMPHFWTRRSLEKPRDTAMSVAHSFLGIQLQCAECHKHPFDRWTQRDYNDFARFFESLTPRKGRGLPNGSRKLRLLRSHVVTLAQTDDPRRPIMKWMRNKNNPWFARAFVNRVWASYFHIGIVDPPDQFTPANPPSNPQLLQWLTKGFVQSGYNMKWLHRQIASSHAYQRTWKPNSTNGNDRRNFSRAIPRRIPAEVFYDALKQATAATDQLQQVRLNLKRRASGHLSMRMAGTHAMKVFGKPNRSINCDCERVNQPSLLQAIFVQNDPLVRMRLADSGWIKEISETEKNDKKLNKESLIEQAWLRTVNRPPKKKEVARVIRHLDSAKSLAEGLREVMWALLNTKEFLLNH